MLIDTELFIWLSFALSFGAPMLYAAMELRSLRRHRPGRGGGGGGSAIQTPPRPKLPDDDGLPPLPPELVELVTDARAPAARPRELETV